MAEDALAHALKKRRQISITVVGRRTGRPIKIPVWFVFEANTHAEAIRMRCRDFEQLEKPQRLSFAVA